MKGPSVDLLGLTSLPVSAFISKKRSTIPLTSLAALALLTIARKGRVNLIKPPSSEQTGQGEGKKTLNNLAYHLKDTVP